MTARQLASQFGTTVKQSASLLEGLARHALVECLNPGAPSSRLYWLTAAGKACQQELRHSEQLLPFSYELPDINWQLYGWICFRHRAAILKVLTEPLQPATIKRRARSQNPLIRMSANNVRDVIRLLVAKGIVCPVVMPRKKHLLYKLTALGATLRQLLFQAESPLATQGGAYSA